jgi:hypothetical protein
MTNLALLASTHLIRSFLPFFVFSIYYITGKYCEFDWSGLYWVYVLTFSILFGFIGLVAFVQLVRETERKRWRSSNQERTFSLFVFFVQIRFWWLLGCAITIQKLLHFLFVLLGIGRAIWLQYDPHDLRQISNPYVDNIIYGLGLYIIAFSYIVVVMLW